MTDLSFACEYDYSDSRFGIEVPVRLWADSSNTVSLLAKFDTGATFCIFNRAYAERIGLVVENGRRETIGTATGQFHAYAHSVTMSCLEWEFETTVYFAADESFSRNVVGLNGWLDRFRLALIHQKSLLYLSHFDD